MRGDEAVSATAHGEGGCWKIDSGGQVDTKRANTRSPAEAASVSCRCKARWQRGRGGGRHRGRARKFETLAIGQTHIWLHYVGAILGWRAHHEDDDEAAGLCSTIVCSQCGGGEGVGRGRMRVVIYRVGDRLERRD